MKKGHSKGWPLLLSYELMLVMRGSAAKNDVGECRKEDSKFKTRTMKKPVASSRANSSIVMVVDSKDGRTKYHVRNRLTVKESHVDVWDLAKRRYRRAIRIFRERIDSVLSEVYPNVPVYRDSDVSEIITFMHSLSGVNVEDVAHSIYQLIEKKNNGKQEDFPSGRD
jgi:hypothetical protein